MTDRKELDGKFRNFLLAYILTALSSTLGTIISSIIAGNMLSVDAVSAIGLSRPVTQLYYTLHLFISAGAGMLTGRRIGAGDRNKADILFSETLLTILSLSIIIAIAGGLVFSDAIVNLICSNEDLRPLAFDYTYVLLLGAPAYFLVFFLNTMVAVDGQPGLVTFAIITDTLVNLLLAPLFIKVFGWGVRSSSAAVIIGHTVGCLILLTHWRRKSPSLSLLGPQRMSFARDLGSILSSGAPLAVASVCLTLLLFSANSIVLDTLGRGGIFIFSVAMNLLMMYNLFLSGSCNTLQSLGSIIAGSGDREALRYVIRKTVAFMTLSIIIICSAVLIWPQALTAIFGGASHPELVSQANGALRIFALSFIPFCYIYVFMIVCKLLGRDKFALMISLMLSLTVIPVLYLMARYAPDKIWYSYLIAYGIEIAVIALVAALTGRGRMT